MQKISVGEEFVSKIKKYVDNKAEEAKISIQQLNIDFNDGLIIIDEDYQRGYLYENKPKTPSRLIESIFMGVVIPEIQLFQKDDMTYELIDGQQRVLSLLNFFNNKFALKDLEVLSELNGYYYRDLPQELQLIFKKFNVNQRITRRNNEFKFDMFERLNTGSQQLNKQEIRNCIYRGKVMKLAKELSSHSDVKRTLYGISNERGKRTEFVLRLLAIVCNDCKQLHGSATANINKFLESENAKNMSEKQLDDVRTQFLSTCRVINEALDFERFFKSIKYSYGNASKVANHVESLFVSIYTVQNKQEIVLNSKQLTQALFNLLTQNEEYESTTIQNSGAAIHTNKRIYLTTKKIGEVISKGISLDDKRSFTKKEKNELWFEKMNKAGKVLCGVCGNPIYNLDACEVDHIIPWSKGGKTDFSNAQLTHKTCNRMKSDDNR